MGIKVKCFGWRHPQLDQISRIEKGFLDLGHELVDNNPDLIYSHDFSDWDNAFLFKQKYPNAKYFQKVLDIAEHLIGTPYYNLEENKNKLLRANLILANSKTVQNNIKKYFNLESYPVYDAIKKVNFLNLSKDIPFIYVGRANDPNKRFDLIKETLKLLQINENSLMVVGPDNANFGNYLGIINDNKLNEIYNRSKYIIFPSQIEGIGLPPLEACICGCIPIICSDNYAGQEFLPQDFVCHSNSYSIAKKIIDIENNYDFYRQIAFEKGIIYKEQFSAESVCKRILDLFQNR